MIVIGQRAGENLDYGTENARATISFNKLKMTVRAQLCLPISDASRQSELLGDRDQRPSTKRQAKSTESVLFNHIELRSAIS